MARRARAATPAIAVLVEADVDHVVHAYRHDPAAASYGEEAAELLDVDPARVHKTLLVDTGGGLAVGVVPVDAQLDLKAMASALAVRKVQMADPDLAARRTGYVVGGISPLGQARPHPTVVDDAALGQVTIFVSAGRRGLEIELAPADLVALTGAVVAPIARR